MGEELNKNFLNEDLWMVNIYLKTCSTALLSKITNHKVIHLFLSLFSLLIFTLTLEFQFWFLLGFISSFIWHIKITYLTFLLILLFFFLSSKFYPCAPGTLLSVFNISLDTYSWLCFTSIHGPSFAVHRIRSFMSLLTVSS